MDWIERLFGFSPDDGDGTVEWLIVVAVLLIGAAVAIWVFARQRDRALRILDFIGLIRSPRRDS